MPRRLPRVRLPDGLRAAAVAAGDKVALRLTLSGTHEGEFQDIPATGRTVSYISHEFYRVADGVIAEEWICSDMASLFRQLT